MLSEAGCTVFPCCIAAISLPLKECLSLLSLPALMMTHTPTHPAEISSHAPKRERGRGERCIILCSCYMQYLFMCPTLPAGSVLLCLVTEIPVLISIPYGFLQGWNTACVFAPLNPWVYIAFIWPTGSLHMWAGCFRSSFTFIRCKKKNIKAEGVKPRITKGTHFRPLSIRSKNLQSLHPLTVWCKGAIYDSVTVGCPPVSKLTLCDICSDAEVQPARAAVP